MNLKEIFSKNKTVISFEIFPPKEGDITEKITILEKYNPAFISLTCGAGGKENKSFDILRQIKNPMPHFTCISSSKESVTDGLKEIEAMGIENILALRGDSPQNPDLICHDFNYANELVSFIKERTSLSIGVAGYPECHIESHDLKTDIENLKRKVDAGADVIFTQLFFDNDKFYKFAERVENARITIPIAAGIMPVISQKQVERMVSMANITLPSELKIAMEKYESLKEYGIDFATKQCEDLIRNEVKGLHFFTLNKTYSTTKILDNTSLPCKKEENRFSGGGIL